MVGNGSHDVHKPENPLHSDDPAVWDNLIEQIGPGSVLYVIETRMSPDLRRRITPEDIWQETLLHVWRSRHAFEWNGIRSFRAWVLKIAENRIRDAATAARAVKRGGGRPEASLRIGDRCGGDDGNATYAGPAGSTTPSRVAIHREQAEAIRAALAALPDDLRDIVRLRLIEQAGVEEVANQIGATSSAVRHRFRKGAALYRQRLLSELGTRSTQRLKA